MAWSSSPEEEVLGKAYDSRLIGRLLPYLRPYAGSLVLAIVKQAIDDAIGNHALDRLDRYAAEYLAVVLGIFGLRWGQTYLLNRAGQQSMHDVRVELFAHVQRQSLAFFDRNPVGRLMTRLTNDVDALNEMLTSGGLAILSDSVTILGIAVALVLLNWQLALLTFLIVPPLLLMTHLIRAGMRASFRAVRIRLARVNALIAENISGIQVIQLFNREAPAYARFEATNHD